MVHTGYWDWLAVYWCGKVWREGKRWIPRRSEQTATCTLGPGCLTSIKANESRCFTLAPNAHIVPLWISPFLYCHPRNRARHSAHHSHSRKRWGLSGGVLVSTTQVCSIKPGAPFQFNPHRPAIYYVQPRMVGSKQLQLGLLANRSYTTSPLPGPYNAG